MKSFDDFIQNSSGQGDIERAAHAQHDEGRDITWGDKETQTQRTMENVNVPGVQ